MGAALSGGNFFKKYIYIYIYIKMNARASPGVHLEWYRFNVFD
jgi:hypothetical protein